MATLAMTENRAELAELADQATLAEQGIDWPRIMRALAAEFDPAVVEWRPAGKGGALAQAVPLVAYISARDVQDRLDAAVGAAWSCEIEPVVVAGGELTVARARLRIYDRVRDGIGTATTWEPSKGAASDALKRAAAMWGVGRYLARLPRVTCQLDGKGSVPPAMLAKLAEALRRRQEESPPASAA